MSTVTVGGRSQPGAVVRRAGLRVPQGLGALALAGSVAASVLLVAAAAERPSVLSEPSMVAFPGWMAGPLHGLLPNLTNDPTHLEALFTGGIVVMSVCWLGAWAFARRLPAGWTIAAVVGANLAFLLGPPQHLTDVFNYIHYGRMQALHGLNPYAVLPVADAHDAAFRWSNWSHLPSPYGPLFTLLTAALTPLGVAGAFWALKTLVVGASLGIVALVWVGVRRAGRDPVPAIALAGLNPLVLVYGVGAMHNDLLVVLAAVAAVVLVSGGRGHTVRSDPAAPPGPATPLAALAGGAAVVAAVALKASAAVYAPVVVLGAHGRRAWAALGAALAALATVLVVDLVYGGHLPGVGLQSRLVTSASIPNIVGALLGQGGATAPVRAGGQVVLVAAIAAASLAVVRGRMSTVTAAGWCGVAAVLTISWVIPWYVLWVLPFAALSSSRALRVAVVLITAYLTITWLPQTSLLMHGLGLYPDHTATGHANHALVLRLLH
jgi:hypothetical protein